MTRLSMDPPISRLLRVAICLPVALLLVGCGGPPAATIIETSIKNYVALGDGFAAAPYTGETDRAKGCLRSDANYPSLLAVELEVEDFTDVTCTYARSEALLRSSVPLRGDEETKVPAQLDAITEETQLVTLTIGLSDRGVLNDLFSVCPSAPCDDDQVPVAELAGELDRISLSLIDKIEAIEEEAPDADIVIVGYPQLLPSEGECPGMPNLSQEEQDAVNAVQSRLNLVLSSVARSSGSDFLDVADLTVGHDICADEPWVEGRKGKKGKSLKYHPLAPLQEAIAEELLLMVEPVN